MKKLICCVGLPGSGKSTWAQEQYHCLTVVIVNKDAIRRELEETGWQWSPTAEQDVVRIRDSRIKDALLREGVELVISDDTNLARKHRVRLEELARQYGATFEVKRFDTPIDECIRRDALREGKAKVGEKVIRDMALRYGLVPIVQEFQTITPIPELPSAIICDLDGTLALFDGQRSPYDASTCELDRLNTPIVRILEAFDYLKSKYVEHTEFLYVSGRKAQYRAATVRWMKRQYCPEGELWMRADIDNRDDRIVKYEIFDRHIRPRFNVLFVLDDRDKVVKMWREIGLTCLQVAEGAF